MRRTTLLPALTAAVLLLGACGSPDDGAAGAPGGATGTSAAGEQPATRTVDSEFGEVTLPTDPQAALGMYTTDLDMLITLGVPLAGSQPIRGDGYTDFPSFFDTAALADVTTFQNFPEYSYEEILAAQPDLILNGLGYDEEVVEKLPEIAPTYSFNGFDGTDWRVKFEQVAVALGREAEHAAWVEKYETKVEDVRARLAEAGVDPLVAPVGYWDGNVNLSCRVPCLVFDDLGLRYPEMAEGQEGTTLSGEQLDRLDDVDVVFTSNAPDEHGELADPFTDLAANPLWAELPFVAGGQVHVYDMEMAYGSPSGQYAFLEVIEEALLP